jgi:hypothetical protein
MKKWIAAIVLLALIPAGFFGYKALSAHDDSQKNAKTAAAPTPAPATPPTYTSFIKTAVPTAKLTGENLGAGYTENAKVVSDWMQSDPHKANILNPKFTSEAIAVCGKSTEKPGLIIVAHFIQS